MKLFLKLTVLSAAILILVASCGGSEDYRGLVINELMPTNRTGILNDKGKPADWIEIKNTSADSIDLKGVKLRVTVIPDTLAKEEDEDTSADKKKSDNKKETEWKWSFPSVKIGAGQCLVVFTGKGKEKKERNEDEALTAEVKLPKKGACVQLLAPNGDLLSEVTYGKMEPDQSISLQNDSTYKATYWQSPGFENTYEGFAQAGEKIDEQRKSPLLIWELMSREGHSYENWVELKNVSDKPVELSAYSIAKKPGDDGWQLPPKTLAPGEIISFQLAGKRALESAGNQASLKLGDSESIILKKDGKFADGLSARLTPYRGSIGRKKGTKGFFFFSAASRGADNIGGYRYIAEKPEWNQKGGLYPDRKSLTLKLNDAGRRVHYTLDGSEPTVNSPVFKDSLVLTKPTVVRSFAEGDSIAMRSNIATTSFLVGEEHDIPVISISVNDDDFNGFNNGIYANGPGYGGDFPYSNANFWKNWTKKAYVEIFDGKEGVSTDCGLKIFGGYSRALPKKSLRLKFRGQYGNQAVDYDFFNTGTPLEIEDLVLRSGSQDYAKYMIKDEFFTSLAQAGSSSILTQMYRPVAVYVNGEYFGLYYLREKIDKNFVARKLKVGNDSVDVYLSGSSPYSELVNKITALDLTKKENFEFVRNNIDLESLIDLKISNIFVGKWDVGNIRHVRSRYAGTDNRWRYVYYDIDASWAPDGRPSAAFALSVSPTAVSEDRVRYNILINRLLQNKEFRQMFLERLAYHLANTYSAETTTKHFDNFIAQIKPEMKQNCKRWPQLSYEQWEKNVAEFRSRLPNRPKVILDDLRKYLSITPDEEKKYFSKLGY